MIGVPTNWQQMRYCIVAALTIIAGDHEADRDDIYSGAVQFHIEQVFNHCGGYIEWDDRSPFGKAWRRAMDSLHEDGTVVSDDFGYRLAAWGRVG